MAISLVASLSNLAGIGKAYLNRSQSAIGEVFIDCSHAEIIEYAQTITDHPVENGESITDHIYTNPVRVKVQGSIIDAPVDIFGSVKSVASLFTGGNVLNNIKETYLGKGRKQVTAYEALKDLATLNSVITIVNYWDTFNNMVIESLSFPRDEKTGARLYFEATLKQVTFANVALVTISSRTRDALNTKTKLGSQPTKAVTVEQKEKVGSFLFNKAGGILGLK